MKAWLAMLPVLLFQWSAQAQGFSLEPSAGYFMHGDVRFYEGDLKVYNKAMYSLDATYMVTRGIGFQLGYSFSPTDAEFRTFDPTYLPDRDLRLNTHHVIGSAIIGWPIGKALLHFTPGIGLAVSDPSGDDKVVTDQWFITGSIAGGVRVQFSEMIGGFFRARLLTPFSFYNNGVYCGIGLGLGGVFPGCGLGLNGDFLAPQGDLSVGLIIKLTRSD